MRVNDPKILVPIALAILLIFALSLFTGGQSYSTDLQDLQKQFNADKGKVRLVMLLSPT